MKYFGSSPPFYLLFALVAACGSEDGAAPASSAPAPFGNDPSEMPPPGVADPATPSEEPVAPGGSDTEGMDPNISLDGSPPGGTDTPPSNVTPPVVTPEPEPPAPGPPETLRDAAELSGRLIGTAISANKLNNATYAATARQFNYVTPENEMKWDAIERNPNVFSFNNADRIVQFAEDNAMQVKGHTLVWHSQLPAWVKALTTRDEVLAAMTNHITTAVTHYKGRIHAWDVVNEAFTDGNARLRGSLAADATDPANGMGNSGSDSVFRRLIGEDFIDRAFQIANAADPDVLLFYNDYNTEGTTGKANAVFNMVQGMVQRGIPIDGVGMQMHINSAGGVTTQQLAQNIERLTGLGLQVVFSELDVTLCGTADIAERRQAQRQRLADVTAACTAQPLCTAITVWGVSDSDSWRDSACNGGRSEPLLFDANYQPKAAYTAVFDALVAAPQAAGGQ